MTNCGDLFLLATKWHKQNSQQIRSCVDLSISLLSSDFFFAVGTRKTQQVYVTRKMKTCMRSVQIKKTVSHPAGWITLRFWFSSQHPPCTACIFVSYFHLQHPTTFDCYFLSWLSVPLGEERVLIRQVCDSVETLIQQIWHWVHRLLSAHGVPVTLHLREKIWIISDSFVSLSTKCHQTISIPVLMEPSMAWYFQEPNPCLFSR